MRSLLGSRAVRLLGATALTLGLACSAADADTGIGQVTKGVADSSNPDDRVPWAVQATLSGNTRTVTNPPINEGLVIHEGNGDLGIITSVDLNGPGGYTGNGGNGGDGLTPLGSFTAHKPFVVTSPSPINECFIMDSINAQCTFADGTSRNASGGLSPGQSATITYPTNMPGYLWSVSVNYDYDNIYPNCRPGGYGSDFRFSSSLPNATAAASGSCQPPSKVKITSMHVNAAKGTASFTQTAQRATGFFCELLRDNQKMFANSCGAKKTYGHRLPAGSYGYEVWATSHAGSSAAFAIAGFKIP